MIANAVATYLVIGVFVMAYFVYDSWDYLQPATDVLEYVLFFGICIVTVIIWPWPVGMALWDRRRV